MDLDRSLFSENNYSQSYSSLQHPMQTRRLVKRTKSTRSPYDVTASQVLSLTSSPCLRTVYKDTKRLSTSASVTKTSPPPSSSTPVASCHCQVTVHNSPPSLNDLDDDNDIDSDDSSVYDSGNGLLAHS